MLYRLRRDNQGPDRVGSTEEENEIFSAGLSVPLDLPANGRPSASTLMKALTRWKRTHELRP
jgi:hypothetical protein